MTAKKKPEHDQATDPRPDFDFEDEEQLDKTVPPIGQPAEPKGK